MKITLITPLFSLAGVPLAQLRFARILATRGHDVDLILGRVEPGFNMPEDSGFKVINLRRKNVRSMFLPIYRYLKTNQPDVVFSAEDHLNAMVLSAAIISRSKSRFSCSSRVTPYDTYSKVLFSKRWFLMKLMLLVMWRADVLSCVSKEMVFQYQQIFKTSRHTYIYNIVADPSFKNRMNEDIDHPWLNNKSIPVLVAAGRLASWKGFADLIHAFSIVIKERSIRLLILGDGPLRNELESQIIVLGLTRYIQLVGYVDNPLKYFYKSDVFVLSSHVEGLPNVLVEAMMCGCTPVATDCPTGPREVLNNGSFGYLVATKDPASLAAGIQKALDLKISSELLQQAVQPFQESAVISRHFELLGISEYNHSIGLLK